MHRYRIILARHHRLIWILAVLCIVGIFFALWEAYRPHVLVHDFDSCVVAGYDTSNTDPQICSDGRHTYAIALSSPPTTVATGPTGVQQPFDILVSGDSRSDYPRRMQVITSQADWSAFWNQVHAKLVPIPQLLAVDFSKQEVIAITAGVQPTSGYSVDLTGVLAGSSGASVAYQEITPAANCQLPKVPSSPYVLVATDKTIGPVTFTPTIKQRKC